jgi:hypothetical protein
MDACNSNVEFAYIPMGTAGRAGHLLRPLLRSSSGGLPPEPIRPAKLDTDDPDT